MPRCVAPTCDRTRPKKGEQKGKCTRPNPWNLYRKRLKGKGFSPEMIADMYEIWIVDWELANPGLTRASKRGKMNETLSQQILGDRPFTRFFAKKEAPPGWSLDAAIRELSDDLRKLHPRIRPVTLYQNKSLFTFRFRPRKGGEVESAAMYRESVVSMKPKKWFTDEVINTYMMLLSGEGNPASKKC